MRYISDPSIEKEVRLKGAMDVVTRADHEVEALIAGRVREAFPDHGLLAEEGTLREGKEYRWVVDPLDGTANFAHGLAWFAVSIALELRGETVLGVVQHPSLEETFVTERGGGAWLSTKGGSFTRLHVSSISALQEALVVTGFPYVLGDRDVEVIPRFIVSAQGLRNMGSAAVHLAYVAAGRAEAFWEPRLNLWDIAAGVLLVEEAGGRVSDLDGNSLRSGDVLATNGRIHDVMLQVIATTEVGTEAIESPKTDPGVR
jgi:myo-inositol-1(or 4)-monophosphatase